MTTMTYTEQLRHPFWQRKRLQVMERAGWACENCQATEITFNVHHKRYVKGRKVWEYELEELIALCENCHASEHKARELLDEVLSHALNYETTRMAVALVAGYLAGGYALDGEIADRARAVSEANFDGGAFLAACALATSAQCAAFIRKIHAEFEHGPANIDPATAATLRRLEAEGPSDQ